MENAIIVPFDLNTARKIKSGEIEGSVLIDNIEIEFVYESKDCAGPYNLLFVKKDGYGISAIYANTEGCIIGGTTLELRVEAGAYFKKGDVLTSTKGCQFIKEEPKYEFKPFDKMLVKYHEDDNWKASLFTRTITDDQDGETKYECLNGTVVVHCIPFEGNECLLGITENPEKK